MTDASAFERLNQQLKENHILHAIAAVVVLFAVSIAYDLYTGSEPAFLEAIGTSIVLGAIYYGGLKYNDSANESD